MPDSRKNKTAIQATVTLPVANLDGSYSFTNASIFDAPIPNRNPLATVDARPAFEAGLITTNWFDPTGVGTSEEYLVNGSDPAPTLNTIGSRYDRITYWEFTVTTGSVIKTYRYKRVLIYLKDVEGATPTQPWVPSKEEVGPEHLVDQVRGKMIDYLGNEYTLEP